MKRINLIALGVFILLVIAVFSFDTKTTRGIQSTVLSVFGFAHKAADAITPDEFVVDGHDYTPDGLMERFSHEELATEHSELVREVNELRIFKQRLDLMQQENDQLREAIGFKKGYRRDLIGARVIKRDSSTWWNTMIIDKGDDDGVVLESPVLSQKGELVGKVISTQLRTSRVLLLTDESCRVAAKILGMTETGIVMGTRSAGRDVTPELVLKYLSKNALPKDPKYFEDPNITLEVQSAGVYRTDPDAEQAALQKPEEMGVFPIGLQIGTITSFVSKEIFGQATIHPAADFTNITDVFVVERTERESGTAAPSAAEVVLPPPAPEVAPAPRVAEPVGEETPAAPPSAEPVSGASGPAVPEARPAETPEGEENAATPPPPPAVPAGEE